MSDEDRAVEFKVGWDAALQSIRHELARAWDEGRVSAIADHRPPLTGFVKRENPYRDYEARP